jgi:hypothetical protein
LPTSHCKERSLKLFLSKEEDFNWDSFPGEFLFGVGLPFKNTGT